MAHKITKKQTFFLEALNSTLGNISSACRKTGIPRRDHYNWMKSNEAYKAKVEEVPEIIVDFYETSLNKLVQEGNVTAIIFGLKCKGKSRGWVERSIVEHEGRIDSRVSYKDFEDAMQEWELNEGKRA